MWHSLSNSGNAWKRNKGPFLQEGSNNALWPLALSQNKGLCPSEYQRRASCCHLWSSPGAVRQVCDSQRQKARGYCNLSPRECIFCQTVSRVLVANHVFLGSWMVHICQECHSLRPATLRTSTAHLDCALVIQAGGSGRYIIIIVFFFLMFRNLILNFILNLFTFLFFPLSSPFSFSFCPHTVLVWFFITLLTFIFIA